jgi:acetylcholinesterase
MKSVIVFLLVFVCVSFAKDPAVRLAASDTTYLGRYLPGFNQDVFLGIPYASPRRFTPSTLLEPPKGIVEAKDYGFSCPAYGKDTINMVASGYITLNEDCLNLNIIRPAGANAHRLLPVVVWIYGGGWQAGSGADPRYNLTYIVEQSVKIGKPMIGVSMNYRLAGFGFLFSKEVLVRALPKISGIVVTADASLGLVLRKCEFGIEGSADRSALGAEAYSCLWGRSEEGYDLGRGTPSFH